MISLRIEYPRIPHEIKLIEKKNISIFTNIYKKRVSGKFMQILAYFYCADNVGMQKQRNETKSLYYIVDTIIISITMILHVILLFT